MEDCEQRLQDESLPCTRCTDFHHL